jgi:carotenoid cleavage dioxygenase-like enzyme
MRETALPAAVPDEAPEAPAADGASAARDREALFRTQQGDTAPVALPVAGRLPAWLTGSLIRTGPARFEVGPDTVRHWFDGHAMLHQFRFTDGRVTYAGRFLRSHAFTSASAAGHLTYREFATDPCLTLFQRVRTLFAPRITDNANINVLALGDRTVAMTETVLPVEFDRDTLATVGVLRFPDRVGGALTTAHPHVDRDGTVVNYVTRFGRRCAYAIYRLDPVTLDRTVVATIPVREPAYMHSFGATDRHVILAEFPFVVDPLSILLSGKPFIDNFQWRPERGTRFTIIDRGGSRSPVICEGPPCFAFHHVHTTETADALLVDVIAYDDPSIIAALQLAPLRDVAATIPASRFRRYRLPLAGGTAVLEHEHATALELPRVHDRVVAGTPYRYVYGPGPETPGAFLTRLVKLDVTDGTARTWSAPRHYPGEAVFVPTPGGTREDDGVLLSVVLDGARHRSVLLVLDATTMTELARAEAPHAIPADFHGQYFDD